MFLKFLKNDFGTMLARAQSRSKLTAKCFIIKRFAVSEAFYIQY